jgi:hypothetical protein
MALRIIDGRKFTWKQGKGTTDASDLGFQGWPASFYILSHRTGQQKLFLLGESAISNDRDRELQSVDYFNPGGNVSVTIFND